MIAGGILAIVVLGIFALLLNRLGSQPAANADINQPDILELAYCNEEQIRPCVVSFGLDIDNNMLVNFLLPDLSYPEFYLQVVRGDVNISYECQRIASALNNAYCIGEKLPPGESLRLILISNIDGAILAQGSLSILGLAFPTLDIFLPTDSLTGTPAPITPTGIFDFVLPTATPTQFDYPSPRETTDPPLSTSYP